MEDIKHIVDGVSLGTVLGSFTGSLPSVAAVFSIVWTVIRIYETATMQRLLGKQKRND